MGKSSKSKVKKLVKQERTLHLKNVKLWHETMSTLDNKFNDSLGGLATNGRKRERIEILEEQLELTLKIEEAFAFINQYQFYKRELSGVCSCLLLELILSVNYIQASNICNVMMNYPLIEEFSCRIKPCSDLLLLWTGRENVDRKDAIAKITENAFDVIHREKAPSNVWMVFLEKTLTLLVRQPIAEQHFEKIELLSVAMLKRAGIEEFAKEWIYLAQGFLVFSYIDKLRFYFLGGQEQGKVQAIIRELQKMRPQLTNGTAYLANSLLEYYNLICKKEEHSLESRTTIANKCITSLEEFIAFISRYSQNACHTCFEEDTRDQEILVCQGCRVVSYCCKYHQRLNYLHHEKMGTRGLGHKHLCPVFKAYRRKRDNTDTSKEGHLERKFQRACKRFLRGTLENNLQQTRHDLDRRK